MQPDRTVLDPGARHLVPVTVRDPGVPGPIPHRPEGGGWQLPRQFENRFPIEGGPLAQHGGEAVAVYRLRNRRILKIYEEGAGPAADVWRAWHDIDSEHVVRLVEFGHLAGHAWEVTRFAGRRTLRDLIADHPDGLDPVLARTLIAQLAEALRALGTARVVHRDLKPGNVLLDESKPGAPRLQLIDFGVSAFLDLPLIETTNNGCTVRYAAPEMLVRSASAKSDYWSLGMIAAELATGRHPLDDLVDDRAVRIQIVQNAIPVAETMDPRIRRLCLGLLVGNHHDRWGTDEVGRWLSGTDVPEVPEQRAPAVDRRRLRFAGMEFRSPTALAIAMVQQWSLAAEHFRPGGTGWDDLVDWTTQFDEPSHPSFADRVHPHVMDPDLPAEVALARMVARLDPGLPPQYRGVSLAHDDLVALAEAAAGGGPGEHRAILTDLWNYCLLPEFDGAPGGRGLAALDVRWRASERRWAETRRAMIGRHAELEQVLARWDGPQLRAWLLWAATDPAGSQAAIDRELTAAQRTVRARLGGGRLDWFDEIVAAAIDPTDRLAAHAAATAALAEAQQMADDETERRHGIQARHHAWRRREAWRRLDRPVALGWAAVSVASIMIALVGLVMLADTLPFAGAGAVLTAWIVVLVTCSWHAVIEFWMAAEIGSPYHPGYSLLLDLGRRGRVIGRRFRRRGAAGLIGLIGVSAVLVAVLLWAPWTVPAVSVPVHLGSAWRRFSAWQTDHRRRYDRVVGGTDQVTGDDVLVPMGGNTR
ncbi:protein kinase domain-containing protein [Actinoplanes sp. RD1]|uniref:protein kinase domain-containing protein n=1 Tax=Actinoplanes sp. RD1 TaxID=3064538 RepID=UPI0027424778|nr:protein kinase [Actinoplanes sp. RD1]